MDPLPDTTQSPFHGLRILVLHNQDFSLSSNEEGPTDLAARSDVVYAVQDIGRALAARGHFVEIQAIDKQDLPDLWNRLKADTPDLVFNLCESLAGDDRHEIVVPALLDLLQIPYTGSGPFALGIALRKEYTQNILKSLGISVPYSITLEAEPSWSYLQGLRDLKLPYPLIVKLTRENASVGIDENSVVYDESTLLAQIERLKARYHQPLLLEQYIEGKEINVSLLGNLPPQILPLHEIDFSQMPQGHPRIISYIGKWDKQSPEYLGSSPKLIESLSTDLYEEICRIGQSAFKALELHDYARCDIRICKEGKPYLIDVNPNCDLSKDAGFARAAALAGFSYEQMIEQIAFYALSRSQHARNTKHYSSFIVPFLDSTGTSARSAGNQSSTLQEFDIHGRRDRMRPRIGEQRALSSQP